MNDHNIESIDQAQRAQMLTNGEDPSTTIPFFRQSTSPIGDLVDQQYRSQKHSPIWPIYSVPPAITAPVVNPEKDKLTKMKQRKEARKERAEKKVKTVIVDGDRETPYDFEKVLQELGEADSNKKANSNNSGAKGKKAKVERKRSKNNNSKKETIANNNTSSSNDATKETTPASSGRSSEGGDEEDEVKTNSKISTESSSSLLSSAVENMPEFLSTEKIRENNSSVINSSNNNISGVNLTRQTSRSTGGLFTPVIEKQNRWKNKKVSALTTKDDSGHTCSSASSASSTTSSSAMTSTANDKSRPYNLRRKSALRPSQSFDTMKSTTSSVVSDGDTMEAAASRTSTKDQLDLASDFPPLMAAAPVIGGIEPPKWVTPSAFKSSNTQAPCNMDSQNVTTTNTLSSAAHLTSSSSTAVIDASDDSKNNQQIISQTLCIGPPPDVTVGANCQQCTSTGLPDVAAQAPFFMNTANSSSGVSSNAGDLTPPQTSVSEQSFFTLGEVDHNSKTTSTPNKHSEIKDNTSGPPAVVMFTGDGIGGKFQNSNAAAIVFADDDDNGDNNQIEFGFEVNVLDFIGDSELNEDDNAIISFVPNKSNTITNILDSPESGIDSMTTSNITTDNNNAAAAIGCVIMQQNKVPQPPAAPAPQEPLINEAVKIPNYTQVVQFVQRQWNQVQKELKQGLVYQF